LVKRAVEFLVKNATGDQCPEFALPPDLLQTHPRGVGVYWGIARAGFHDAEDRGDCARRLLQINPYAIPAHYAVRNQELRHLITQLIEFSISDRVIEQPRSFRIRPLPGGCGKKLM